MNIAILDQAARCSRTDLRVLRSAIDRRLAALVPQSKAPDDLDAAIRASLLAPGKRIRPMLTVLAAWELGPADLRALDAACALEMVHAASLILDDMPSMDDARLRRGLPATHVAFGEDVALLTVVSLIARAFATLGGAAHLHPATRATLVAILAEAVGSSGLARGQFADLRGAAGPDAEGRLARSNHLKTGVLFVAAIDMAGAIADAGGERIENLRRCATELGQAFQLLDDLIDGTEMTNSGERTEDAGRVNLMSLLGRDEVRDRVERHMERALGCLRPQGGLAALVRGIFELHLKR